MNQKEATISEFDRLVELLLYFEGYTADDGVSVDFSKLSKKNFTRTQIILHSIAIFSQKGVTDTTVQDLLEAAQVSRRTFYKYFKDKFDVLENIYTLSINMLSKQFSEEADEINTIEELIDKTVDVYFSYHTSMGNIIRIMQEEGGRLESPLNKRRKADRNGFAQAFEIKVKKLQNLELDKIDYYSVFWILENTSIYLLTETECSSKDIEKCKSSMRRLIGAIIVK